MIKRRYFVFAKCYSEHSTSVYSQHYFSLETKSWLPPPVEDIFKEIRRYVIERSDYAEGDKSKISIISLSRI